MKGFLAHREKYISRLIKLSFVQSVLKIGKEIPNGKWEVEPVRKSSPPVVGSITWNRGNEEEGISFRGSGAKSTTPTTSAVPPRCRRSLLVDASQISSRAFVRLLAAGHNSESGDACPPFEESQARTRGRRVRVGREHTFALSYRPCCGRIFRCGWWFSSSRNVMFSNENVFDRRFVYLFIFIVEKLV